MNVAFEISPLITASGTFGDKSGVYRYMYGLLFSLADIVKKKNGKIILFSFNESLLTDPLNPEISRLIDNKNIYFVTKLIPLGHAKGFGFYIQKLINMRANYFFRILNRIFFVKPTLELLSDRIRFRAYLKYLGKRFKKNAVKVILHSETGFFNIDEFKNVITMYDLTPINFPEFHRIETKDIQKRKLRFIEDSVHGLVCISRSTKNDVLKYSERFKDIKIMIGYPGLDKVFQESYTDRKNSAPTFKDLNLILKKYKNNIKKRKYFLYYGTFEPRKNVVFLVKAFSELQNEKKIPADFKLILSGGEGWGRVKRLITNYVRENYPIAEKNNIVLMDYLNDEYIIEFIKNAYAITYPSLYEGFGLPVLESMALGTPVICSKNSSLPEVGGTAVLYVNPQDYFDLKEKMSFLINNPKFAKSLAKSGLIQSKKFRWEKTAKNVYEFLSKL